MLANKVRCSLPAPFFFLSESFSLALLFVWRFLFFFQVRTAGALRNLVLSVLKQETALDIHYVSVGDADSMRELSDDAYLDRPVCVSLAATLAGVRLIDNMIFSQ